MTHANPSPTLTLDANGVGWLTFDDPGRSANVLDEATMGTLATCLSEAREAATSGRLRVLVVDSGKEGTFIVGADVEAIAAIDGPDDGEAKARVGQALYLELERLPVPTVAAIDGICLGGGLELTLACRYRVCSDHAKTRLGFPEVQLGLLPGWGGTTRLPRLVGLQAALDLMVTGNPIRPDKARRIGLVSEVFPHAGFHDRAAAFALDALDLPQGASRRRRGLTTRLLDDTAPGRRVVLATARRRVMKKTGGRYPAPLKILEVLKQAAGLPLADALTLEARAFGELTATPTHANLLHVFHLREGARKTQRAVPGGSARPVNRLGVVGAGVMGGGIAQLAAFRDVDVRMKDIRDEAVAGGLQHARSLFDAAVKRRKLTPAAADRKMDRIHGGLDWNGFHTADLVIEAVVERIDVKRAVLGEAEEVVADECVLATNTSSLSVDEMAAGLRRPERFCGIHFFNPVDRMPLVEIIRGKRTDDDTVATAHAVALALGKVPVICRDGPGFLVNRILGPYLNEAGHLLADGCRVEVIDKAATEFGMPMGPLRLMDEVGLDIARHAGATLHEAFGARMAPAAPLIALGETPRLGRKNEHGFYLYQSGKSTSVDPGIYADLGDSVPNRTSPTTSPALSEIRERLVLAMINEAARVLEDRIVDTAGEVDLGMIMGTGFPPFRGGLLRFADAHHPRSLVEKLERLEAAVGPRFAPAPVLLRLARDDRGFYDAFGEGA